MKTSVHMLFRCWGWNTQGDFGPFTFYTSKRFALVFFLRSPPTSPPSGLQRAQRKRFGQAAREWSLLSGSARAAWEEATKRTHLAISAINLWMYWKLSNDRAAIATIEHQSGISLLPP